MFCGAPVLYSVSHKCPERTDLVAVYELVRLCQARDRSRIRVDMYEMVSLSSADRPVVRRGGGQQ